MDKSGIIKEAQRHLAKGQIDKAISEFEKLLDLEDGNIYNMLGDLYLKKGDTRKAVDIYHRGARIYRDQGFYDKAKAIYKKLLNLNPSDYRATIALGELSEEKGLTPEAIKYYLVAADMLAREKKRDELANVYQRILNLSPSNLQMRIKVADLFYKEGLSGEAAKQYSVIGRLYQDSGDLNKARDYYEKAISINPSERGANLGLSEIYQKQGNYRGAIETLKRLLETSPDDVNLLTQYVNVLVEGGNVSLAEGELKKLIELDPSNVIAKKYLANLYLKQDRKEEAWNLIYPSLDQIISFDRNGIISILEELKDIEPAECTRKLIVIYRDTGNIDKAFEELVNLGDFYLSSGMTAEALNCYREAQTIRPDDPYVRTKLLEIETPSEEVEVIKVRTEEKGFEELLQEADIYLKFGVYEEARKRLEALKVQYPQEPEVHLKLKQLYIEIGDREMAVTECLALSEIYRRQGMMDEAEEYRREALSINPDDPRLVVFTESIGTGSPELEEEISKESLAERVEREKPLRDEYIEAFTEAEFYEKQGLMDEALKLYRKLQNIFPEDEEIAEKIESLLRMQSSFKPGIKEESSISAPSLSQELEPELINLTEALLPEEIIEEKEPELTDSVMDIFEEFKKGLEAQVKEEDSETHYNLGIAYKEMGFIDDAIKEFQLSRRDPARFIPSMSMLALCYKEKGFNKLAIETLEEALRGLDRKAEEYLAMKYELADVYEKDGDTEKAYDLFMEVYGIDSSFRDVSKRIESLKRTTRKNPFQEKPSSPDSDRKKKDRISYI
ncbi:MAG: tetratricopeptide repeat protein [Thermodesulfovibrionales bacterium]|nr:tetratricopeptide repeat protein [Thermodesulfovibrionales bacterium]